MELTVQDVAPVAETVSLSELHAHPRNYRAHPEDQLEHLAESIREHGLYRNIVIARDGTILAGHGVAEAARSLGLETVPVIRLDLDPEEPRALKVLTGDNGIGHLAESDDRALTELLREIKDTDLAGLLGTGYDEMMLANLVMVTRPASEIGHLAESSQWVGMPDYEAPDDALKLIVSFRNAQDREACAQLLGVEASGSRPSVWWPAKEREDPVSLRFDG